MSSESEKSTQTDDTRVQNHSLDSGVGLYLAGIGAVGSSIVEELRRNVTSSVIASAEGISAFGGFRDPRVRARLRQSLRELQDQPLAPERDQQLSTE